MVNTILASLALAGSAVASSVGSAYVVNKCDYEVTLCNVPASGGGYDQEDKTLAAGESWTQAWTELSNGNGWSIKLSKSASLENILQYEYTFHNDGIIWYDLSCVNGNPWDKDWEITASGADCSPKQQAYRYATDDAYGMQSCASSADITVTLCTGVSADNGNSTDAGSGSGSASAPSYESTSASAPSYSSSTSAPAPVAYTASSSSSVAPIGYGPWTHGYEAQTTPTTLATSASLTTEVETYAGGAITITEVETAYVTAVVTAYEKRGAPAPNRFRRHEHHAHAHQHEQ
ncbi:Antigenic thaumatin-like protein [Pseudocercospora fuligena]|uniref:Antigenic thaumatin-like protein n=1 Tax=Pseudocercospora fuligena TaxID=685502 RepID=A0A8H6VI84_9PEZI|nr:Antigenic thaumatin-like protein [Pseudocercospora fuligena]